MPKNNRIAVNIGKAIISVLVVGEGSTLVWCHGVTSSIEYEDRLSLYPSTLFPGGFRLLRYDAIGHGHSTGSTSYEDYIWQSLADDLLSVVHDLGLRDIIIGGTSMGCATSIYAALKGHKGVQIRGLVLANPPTAWNLRETSREQYQKFIHLLNEGLPSYLSEVARRPIPEIFASKFPNWNTIKIEYLEQYEIDILKAIYLGAIECDLPLQSALTLIRIPTLILAWDTDPGHPVQVATYLHESISSSKLFIAKSLSSIYNWNRLIREFMDDLH